MSLVNTRRWRCMIVCILIQAATQCFGSVVYCVTSNAGEVALLIGISITVISIQRDLG